MKWHLVHKDGREWTQSEVEELKVDYDWGERVAIDMDGYPILLGRFGHYCYADEVTDDIELVVDDWQEN